MKGYGVNVHAPRKPFVTTTVLLEWPFGWAVGPLWRAVRWFVASLSSQILGSVGLRFGASDPSAARAYHEPFREAAGFGSDEFL